MKFSQAEVIADEFNVGLGIKSFHKGYLSVLFSFLAKSNLFYLPVFANVHVNIIRLVEMLRFSFTFDSVDC